MIPAPAYKQKLRKVLLLYTLSFKVVSGIKISFLIAFQVVALLAYAGSFADTLRNKISSVAVYSNFINKDSAEVIIPFARIGNLIIVKGKADTTEGNFILDTGSPHLVLNITYFRNYPQRIDHGTVQESITGSGSPAIRTTVRNFSIGPMNYPDAEADLVGLGHIENSRGIKILGLLGTSLFRNCELIIDFDASQIHLYKIGNKEKNYQHKMLGDTSAYETISFDFLDGRIITNAEVGGKKLKMVIDCAAESSVLDSRLSNKVFENISITRRVMLAGAGNEKVEALYGNVRGLKIGNRVTAVMPVLITNLEKTCFAYAGCVDGVLGFDFLALQKVGINFVNRKLYLWK